MHRCCPMEVCYLFVLVGLTFNFGKFAIIKIVIENTFTIPKKVNRITVSWPIGSYSRTEHTKHTEKFNYILYTLVGEAGSW